MAICKICNKFFHKVGNNNCCPSCKRKYGNRLSLATCTHCGVIFVSNNKKRICDDCKKEIQNRKQPKIKETVCKHCHKIFIKTMNHQMFCSTQCRVEYKKLENIKYVNCRVCGQKSRTVVCHDCQDKYGDRAIIKTCKDCGKKFISNAANKRKYCDDCQNRSITCVICGKEYKSKNHTKARYCSIKCAHKAQALKQGIKVCIVCGKEFYSHHPDAICCSVNCVNVYTGKRIRKKALKRKSRMDYGHKIHRSIKGKFITFKEPKTKLYSHVCIECGALFESKFSTAKYCSKSCGWKAGGRQRRYKTRHSDTVMRDEITYFKLAQRDGWICGICHKPIDPEASHDHLGNGAVIDHIRPLSKGGEHSWSNVQLAHWKCNSEKSDKLEAEQLRLPFAF